MKLEGKRIIVTGGSKGIGAATVKAYVREGAIVASLDVDDSDGKKIVEEANSGATGKAMYYHCDIAKRDEVKSAFRQAIDDMGGLDVLVNNAGVERTAAGESIEDAEWDLIMDVNVRGTMLTNQIAFPDLKEHGGAIINFGSVSGLRPSPQHPHYSASKGAVHSWTRSVAHAWGAYNIRVNAVLPAIWTPMYDNHRSHLNEQELAAHDAGMAQAIPLGGKLGDPEKDLAPLMVFLASDDSRFITAQLIPVDGGLGQVR